MKIFIYSLLIILPFPLIEGTKTFIREYTYTAGEADSKITSRAIALDQIKKILLEEIGIYLQSEIQITKEEKNNVYNDLTKQQILSITAGVTETKILEEKWNGDKYYIKASIMVNPDEVIKNIARIGSDRSNLKELEDVKRKADDAFAEIERLRKELEATQSERDKLEKQKKYNAVSNTLSASDWFQKGKYSGLMKEYDNSAMYFLKAIELNPEYSEAYNGLGNAYYFKNNFNEAIKFYRKAISLNPKYSKAYANLGLAYYKKGNFEEAIQDYQMAIELDPQNASAYVFMGAIYHVTNNPRAIELYKKGARLGDKDIQQWLRQHGYTW